MAPKTKREILIRRKSERRKALADPIEKLRLAKPRHRVMTAYRSSVDRYEKRYKKLAE